MIITLTLFAAIAVALFMGLNIGGNNTAAAMGAAYGAKVRTKLQAVILIAIFAILGAIFSGHEVIKTLGSGILPSGTILIKGAIIAVGASAATVFLANIIRMPISTSQVAVGSVIGLGFFYGASKLNTPLLGNIVIWWVITPVTAWLLSYIMGKYLYTDILIWIANHSESENSIRKSLNVLLTISGCYVAFSAGANHAGIIIGPFVGTGEIPLTYGADFAGIAIGLGAFLMGGRVLDTVGKEICELCAIRAFFVEFTSAVIVHCASIFGIPVSIGEIVASGVIGIGCASNGIQTMKNNTVKKIMIAWVISPIVATMLTFILIKLF